MLFVLLQVNISLDCRWAVSSVMLAGYRLPEFSMPEDKRMSIQGRGKLFLKVVCVFEAGGKVQPSPFGKDKAGFRFSNMHFPFLAHSDADSSSFSFPCL